MGFVTRERCPKCGGRLETEGERWDREAAVVERSYRCGACGARLESSVRWPHGTPPSESASRTTRSFAGVGWSALALIVVWVVLRSLDYGTGRVAVYSAVARAGEAFVHPAWPIALLTVAAAAFALSRRRGATALAPAAMAPSVRLGVDEGGGMSIAFSGPRGAVAHDSRVARNLEAERRLVESFQAIARRSVAFESRDGKGEWSRDEIEETQRELYALGLAIGSELLGGKTAVAAALADLPGDHLQLGVHGELADVPWELLVPRKGGRFLWQLFSVARQLLDDAPIGAGRPARPGARRMLLLANLESASGRLLPAAEREAADLLELGATRPDLLKVVRKAPRDADELGHLLKEGFDLVHFAGHSGLTDSGARGWTLGNGEAVAPGGLLRGGDAPVLVFANACSSGSEPGGGISESARDVMIAGAGAYVGTLAELHDSGSATMSGVFYRALVRGETLGDALTAARSTLVGVHPFVWSNYVLYGDPAARLL